MPRAISIHVGVNTVTSNVFTAPKLNHAEDDAMVMFDLAKKAGFEKSSLLLGTDAKYSNVTNAVLEAANDLDPGGIFLFTFSGHGDARFLDNPAVPEKPGEKNETIVLTDHMLFDEVWQNELWPKFKENTRAVAVLDCCNAAGALTSLFIFLGQLLERTAQVFGLRQSTPRSPVVKALAAEERKKEIAANKEFYTTHTTAPANPLPINVKRILLSACGAQEKALEGPKNGLFTAALLEVWNQQAAADPHGVFAFPDSYDKFMDAIKDKFVISAVQHPQLTAEPSGPMGFTAEHPFSL
jgi:hypothetical protein